MIINTLSSALIFSPPTRSCSFVVHHCHIIFHTQISLKSTEQKRWPTRSIILFRLFFSLHCCFFLSIFGVYVCVFFSLVKSMYDDDVHTRFGHFWLSSKSLFIVKPKFSSGYRKIIFMVTSKIVELYEHNCALVLLPTGKYGVCAIDNTTFVLTQTHTHTLTPIPFYFTNASN